MKSYIVLGIVLLVFSSSAFSQINFKEPEPDIPEREPPISSIYGELLGNGYSFSVNFDYLNKKNFGFRVGLTPLFLLGNDGNPNDEFGNSYDEKYSQNFQLITMVNYFIGKSSHKLELGTGFVFGFTDHQIELGLPKYPAFTSTVGYRLYPKSTDVTLKISFTPIFSGSEFFPHVGFSIGHIF